jgi:hypothetical protein
MTHIHPHRTIYSRSPVLQTYQNIIPSKYDAFAFPGLIDLGARLPLSALRKVPNIKSNYVHIILTRRCLRSSHFEAALYIDRRWVYFLSF